MALLFSEKSQTNAKKSKIVKHYFSPYFHFILCIFLLNKLVFLLFYIFFNQNDLLCRGQKYNPLNSLSLLRKKQPFRLKISLEPIPTIAHCAICKWKQVSVTIDGKFEVYLFKIV